jgi:hypothetical protein
MTQIMLVAMPWTVTQAPGSFDDRARRDQGGIVYDPGRSASAGA